MKPAANGRYLVCKSLDTTLLFIFTVQKYIYPSVSKVHAGYFLVCVIHRTLTATAGSLTCVREHVYACVYTWGLGTPTASQHIIFDSEKEKDEINVPIALSAFRDGDQRSQQSHKDSDWEKLTILLYCAPDGIRTSDTDALESRVRRSNH